MDISADKKIIHDYDHGVVWITEETNSFTQNEGGANQEEEFDPFNKGGISSSSSSFRLNAIKKEEEVEVEDEEELNYEYEGNFAADVKQEEQEDSYDEKYFDCTDVEVKEESMDSIEEIRIEGKIGIDDCSEGKIILNSEDHVNDESEDNSNQVRPTRSSTRLRKPRIFSNCVTERDPLFRSTRSINSINRKRGQKLLEKILNPKIKINNAIEKKRHICMAKNFHELHLSLSVELGINPDINDASKDKPNQVRPTRSSNRSRKPRIFSNCVTERDPLFQCTHSKNVINSTGDGKLLGESIVPMRIIHNANEKERRILMAKNFHQLRLSLSVDLGINPSKISILNAAIEDIKHLQTLEKCHSMEVRALKLEKMRLSKRLSQDIKRYEKLIARIKEDSEASDLDVRIKKDSEASDLDVRIKKDSESSDLNIRIKKDSESSDISVG